MSGSPVGHAGQVEEREDEPVAPRPGGDPGADPAAEEGPEAVAARTRALVAESRELLARLERLLRRPHAHDEGDPEPPIAS